MTTERDSTMTDRESFDAAFPSHYQWSESNRDKAYFGWKLAMENHLATRNAVVSDESWRPVVSRVLTALDIATGDTDPNIDPDMTDDEVRDEYPEIWAMQQLSLLLANQPESLASRKVAVPDEDKRDCKFGDHYDDGYSNGYADGWNACRQAMLASQDEVK